MKALRSLPWYGKGLVTFGAGLFTFVWLLPWSTMQLFYFFFKTGHWSGYLSFGLISPLWVLGTIALYLMWTTDLWFRDAQFFDEEGYFSPPQESWHWKLFRWYVISKKRNRIKNEIFRLKNETKEEGSEERKVKIVELEWSLKNFTVEISPLDWCKYWQTVGLALVIKTVSILGITIVVLVCLFLAAAVGSFVLDRALLPLFYGTTGLFRELAGGTAPLTPPRGLVFGDKYGEGIKVFAATVWSILIFSGVVLSLYLLRQWWWETWLVRMIRYGVGTALVVLWLIMMTTSLVLYYIFVWPVKQLLKVPLLGWTLLVLIAIPVIAYLALATTFFIGLEWVYDENIGELPNLQFKMPEELLTALPWFKDFTYENASSFWKVSHGLGFVGVMLGVVGAFVLGAWLLGKILLPIWDALCFIWELEVIRAIRLAFRSWKEGFCPPFRPPETVVRRNAD